MKILITSGGTKIPLDPVRSLTNMSKGSFGSRLATAALYSGSEVIYVAAKDAATPFSANFDLIENNFESNLSKLNFLNKFHQTFHHLYTEKRYETFDDYFFLLQRTIEEQQPDVVMLAAAVSDYRCKNYSKSKIRSNQDLVVELEEAPKVISLIKDWAPNTFLVGFKLLVGATDEELIQASRNSITKNGCDLVVANDWIKLKAGNHEVLLVEPTTYTRYNEDVASCVINRVNGLFDQKQSLL